LGRTPRSIERKRGFARLRRAQPIDIEDLFGRHSRSDYNNLRNTRGHLPSTPASIGKLSHSQHGGHAAFNHVGKRRFSAKHGIRILQLVKSTIGHPPKQLSGIFIPQIPQRCDPEEPFDGRWAQTFYHLSIREISWLLPSYFRKRSGRVGSSVSLFEACSAFTHVTACALVKSPWRPSAPEASAVSLL
jgi:hypothetical protein